MASTKVRFEVAGLTRIQQRWGEDPGEFLVQAHCEVTRPGEAGARAFQVTIASPQQLVRELNGRDDIELGRGYLFMVDYDEPRIVARLQRLLDRSGAASWQELAAYVARYFDWIE